MSPASKADLLKTPFPVVLYAIVTKPTKNQSLLFGHVSAYQGLKVQHLNLTLLLTARFKNFNYIYYRIDSDDLVFYRLLYIISK